MAASKALGGPCPARAQHVVARAARRRVAARVAQRLAQRRRWPRAPVRACRRRSRPGERYLARAKNISSVSGPTRSSASPQRLDVAERLRHLLAGRGAASPLCIHGARTALAGALGLRALVLVVREDEIEAAAVHVEAVAQVLARHRRALDVPAGPPVAPRARARTCPRRASVAFHSAKSSGDSLLSPGSTRAPSTSSSVRWPERRRRCGNAPTRKYTSPRALVRQPARDEALDQRDDLRHRLGHAAARRRDGRRPSSEVAAMYAPRSARRSPSMARPARAPPRRCGR